MTDEPNSTDETRRLTDEALRMLRAKSVIGVIVPLLAENERLRRYADRLELMLIEARNPGIDMERVKQERADRLSTTSGHPTTSQGDET